MGGALAILAVMWAAVTAYALLGGADFGAGIWDLLAGGRAAGAPRRASRSGSSPCRSCMRC